METDAGDDERRRTAARSRAGARRSRRAPAAAESAGAPALIRFVRGLIVVLALTLIGAFVLVCVAGAQSDPAQPAGYQISGTVRNGKTLLPGVTVTAANTLTGKKYAPVSSANGTFQFKGLARGR